MMNPNEFYQAILGLTPPWQVSDVSIDPDIWHAQAIPLLAIKWFGVASQGGPIILSSGSL